MVLPRDEVIKGFAAELASFEQLIREIDDSAWRRPSRCAGWTVGDVARHVTGGLADVTVFNFDGVGTPEYTDRQVRDRRDRTPAELADELHEVAKVANDIASSFDEAAWSGPAPPGVPGTLGGGVEALWYDAFLHADDMRAGAGLPSVPGPGIRASISHIADILTQNDYGPATIALDGIEEFPVCGGGGKRITGDAMQFVLAATGRGDPAPFGVDDTINIYR